MASDVPAGRVADPLSRAEREVARRQRAVPASAGRDEALHAVRKAAKRARYLAELSRPELGEPARSAALRYEDEQARLGRHQDAVVAAAFLDRIAADAAAAGEEIVTYTVLIDRTLRPGTTDAAPLG